MEIQTQAPPAVPEFRLFLQEELVRRLKVNPRYSLRAFAKYLQVDPSLLSKLLNGKRRISPSFIRQAAERLELSPEQTRAFIVTQNGPESGEPSLEFQQLTVDHFRLIADWYHYAILELASVEGFRPSASWIAQALGISVPEANVAVERLLRLGLLKREGKKLVACPWGVTTTGNNFTAVAFRKLQKQILTLAIQAMDDFPLEERDQSSITMAVDTRTLALAKRRIRRFRRSLCELMKKGGKYDEVYHLSISLYSVTRLKKGSPA